MDSKPFWQSRTIILNGSVVVLMAALAALEVVQNAGAVVTGTTVLAAVIAALNVVLRFVTSVPITVNNNSGPIAQVGGETFTGATQIGAVAGGAITNVTTSRGVTPTITPPTNGGGPEL